MIQQLASKPSVFIKPSGLLYGGYSKDIFEIYFGADLSYYTKIKGAWFYIADYEAFKAYISR